MSANNGLNRPLCFDIPLVDDDIVEHEECFDVAITLPRDSADLGVVIADSEDMSKCCIQDDDRESMAFDFC